MRSVLKLKAAVWLAITLCGATVGMAQDVNARAAEDIKAFFSKFEEADKLFDQKKFAEAAPALAASHELYLRAERRDSEIGRLNMSIAPGKFLALRHYGYGFGSNASLTEAPTGNIEGSAAGLHAAMTHMWQDAAILGGADKFPLAGAFSDPSLVEMSEENLNSVVRTLYGPVSIFKLPVPDNEWRDVVLWSRRARLIMEFALQKYPEWKTGTREWSQDNNKLQHTGNEALEDVKAKLAEAEAEYAKLASDFKKAAPRRAKEWIDLTIEDLAKAIAGAKKDGWVAWPLARDLFITKDYLADRRKALAPMYAAEGKTMPDDATKPIEDKIAALKSAMEEGASKWKIPSNKPHNATIEAKAAASIKERFAGATILKTAMDGSEWIITKNDLDIPKYRSLGVLVLTKIPGQSLPWLVFCYFRQTYAGGGTYSSGGTIEAPSDVRFQSGS